LLEREWVKQVGVRDTPGRPALFGTTPEFLSYFNLRSISELPPLMDQRELWDIARGLSTPLPPEVLTALEGKSESGASEDSQQDVFDVNLEATGAETPDMVIQTRGQDIDWQFEEGSAVESEVLEPDVET
jgi:segregation and condensation protein B